MSALLKQYFDIAFLMGKPQDLPAGENQTYTGIVLNFITYVMALVSFAGIGDAAPHAAIDIGCTALFLFLALKFTAKLPRYQQALGAICGAGAVLNLAAIPILHLTLEPSGETIGSFGMFARFMLLVWSLSLVAHVIRHTFGIRMPTSIIVAVLYYLFITSVLAAVFPPVDTLSDPTAQLHYEQHHDAVGDQLASSRSAITVNNLVNNQAL